MSRLSAFFVLFLLLPIPLASYGAADRTIWDGVYTEAQARRGESIYRQTCALCHGPRLEGSENGQELLGEILLKPWYGRSVLDLVRQVQKNMPKDDPGVLSTRQAVEALAYILAVNKIPTGAEDLPVAADALAAVRIEPRVR